jgi:hypothetical protein
MTQSARHTTPSASERGATRRGSSGLTPNEALVVVLLQQGKTVAAVAQEIGVSDRQVRRLRASAVRHGAILDPPEPKAPHGDDGRFTAKPEKPPARVPVIGITGGSGAPAMLVRPESREDFEARTGGAGRPSLGKDYSPGDLERDALGNPTGRVLLSSATIRDTGERQRALDAYLEAPPPGSTAAHLYDDEGTLIGVIPL